MQKYFKRESILTQNCCENGKNFLPLLKLKLFIKLILNITQMTYNYDNYDNFSLHVFFYYLFIYLFFKKHKNALNLKKKYV